MTDNKLDEILKEFDEKFLCSVNPDIWIPTLSETLNPLEESETPEPKDIKDFIKSTYLQGFHQGVEDSKVEVLKYGKENFEECITCINQCPEKILDKLNNK